MDYKTIMAEFKDANGVSAAKRKHFVGVSKKGNSWQAIIRDPKLKIEVYLGYYSTPEEAAFVVKKKKAEFEEKLKGEDGLREKRRGSAFQETESEGAALVVKKKKAEFEEKFKGDDGLRMKRCGNAFQETETEEANVVADRKRAELREVCGGKVRGSGECEDDNEVLLECESEVTGNFECSDEQTSDVNVPATAEEAIRSYEKRRAVQMGSDGLNNVEISDKPNSGVVDVPGKLECEFVQGSPTSNIKPGTSNSGCVKRVIGKMSQRKTTCSLDFDEAVRAGFINEYGQLVGKFCELDEQMCLGLTDENFAAS
ncbi:uncharacterized protein LOC141598920 [Silene latifolia]|uniref:uncharacterized protein LOC141598920 n=1 Tax=Silene latifolia TaxID=37657 RepID=UPI003D779969